MPLFGAKRSRTSHFKTTETWRERLDRIFSNEGFLLRLLATVTAVLLLAVAVEAWQPPFTYRLGDKAQRGIVAQVDFERVDTFLTRQAAEEQAQQVSLYFTRIPEVLPEVQAQFQQDLNAVLAAEKQADLPSATQSAFGLDLTKAQPVNEPDPKASDSDNAPAPSPSSVFDKLKEALANSPDPELPEDDSNKNAAPIELVINELTEFLDPLIHTGIADAERIKELNPNQTRQIALIDSQDPNKITTVEPKEVLLSYVLQESGRLGKNWSAFPHLSQIRPFVEHWLSVRLIPTLKYSDQRTQLSMNEARVSTPPVKIKYSAGTVLVELGAQIDRVSLELLQAEYDALQQETSFQRKVIRSITVTFLLAVLTVLISSYLLKNQPQLTASAGNLTLFLFGIVLTVFLARYFSVDPWRAEFIPLLVIVMVYAIAYSQVLSIIVGFALTLMIVVSTTNDLQQFVLLMSVCATAVIPLSKVASRASLIKVGFLTGLVSIGIYWGTTILNCHSLTEIFSDHTRYIECLKGAVWCLVAGYLVAGSLPFIESTFGVVTNISLLEMSDPSHPLLNELVRRAPGTYNHSITVASIGETAADRIGANGLLVRVGAYFHDIGKMLKPEYFIENMTAGEENRHDNLSPSMSTLIIIGHVKDGVDLAKQHHLPPPIIDFIEQHHGTTLVEFFFRQATQQAEEDSENHEEVLESSFRYPGPKPQNRESGVMMLADSVESASRTLSDPTPKRIESLVEAITMKKLLDGQFENSGLTLTEIHTIQESLTKSLIGIYHGRIKYPDQKE